MSESVRMDKFLWVARVYKTRSQATEACKSGKVSIDGMAVKASREVKPGDTICVDKEQLLRTYRVIGLCANRVSAKLLEGIIEDLTPAEDIEKHRIRMKLRFENRPFGLGRPTKKERRIIDQFRKTQE